MTDDLPPPKITGLTLHLTPVEVWERQAGAESYLPEAYGVDGFIHCTDGEENLLQVANHFYRSDGREFVALVVALDRVAAPVRYEDPDRTCPHIYGPLNRQAVVAVRRVVRGSAGLFLRVDG